MVLAGFLALLALVALLVPASAADPTPPPGTDAPATATPRPAALKDLRMDARAMLGGAVRPGAWTAIRVHLENDGPPVRGELRVVGGRTGDSRFGTEVELATGARQDHVLYAQPSWFGGGMRVELVGEDGAPLLAGALTTKAVDQYTSSVVIVAERPEGIVGDVRAGATLPYAPAPTILTIRPEDLPPRVEAWSAIDRLIWQDVDASTLSTEQLEALRGWLSAGGRLVVVGGSTGATSLGALPADLLPYRPAATVDVELTDLEALLGTLPAGAEPVPAVAGILDAGTILGRSGDEVIAAQRPVGQGAVTILGIDPSAEWLAGTKTAAALWRRLLPSPINGAVMNPLVLADDSNVVSALANLPAVDLPDLGLLFALLLGYIALMGPINYLVLRRLDRREWAWVTMPALVVVFAVAAWALGAGLKGTDTIVNQLGIVRTAAGSDTGVGQYYVGIFSPGRASYDVRVADAALLTNPSYLQQQNQQTVPLDVVMGETSRLRDFQVGFAVLRTFRAESAVAVPRIDTDLTYRDGVLTGTLTNRSDRPLEAVAVTWGGAVQRLDSLAAGATGQVRLEIAKNGTTGAGISDMVFGPYPPDGRVSRTEQARRMVLDQLWWGGGLGNGSVQAGPLVLAWAPGPGIGVEVGTPAKQVGDTLLVAPATVTVAGPTVWPSGLITHSVVASDANEAADQGFQLSLSRGTMTVELRPLGLSGPFSPTKLSFMLTQGELPSLTGTGPVVEPLPADRQPDQEDPLGTVVAVPDPNAIKTDVIPEVGDGQGAAGAADPAQPVAPPPLWDGIPDMQLLDRTTGSWVELPHPGVRREFSVADPGRYVDDTGAVLVRFVNRGAQEMTMWFAPLVRLEGVAG